MKIYGREYPKCSNCKGTGQVNLDRATVRTIQIVGATRPCKRCGGAGAVMYPWLEPCSTCKGTGRVFVFGPEVREPCPELLIVPGLHDKGCPVCQGRGWEATRDLAVILEAVEKVESFNINVGNGWTEWLIYDEREIYVDGGTEEGPVFERTLKAIAYALKAAGATLYEEVNG